MVPLSGGREFSEDTPKKFVIDGPKIEKVRLAKVKDRRRLRFVAYSQIPLRRPNRPFFRQICRKHIFSIENEFFYSWICDDEIQGAGILPLQYLKSDFAVAATKGLNVPQECFFVGLAHCDYVAKVRPISRQFTLPMDTQIHAVLMKNFRKTPDIRVLVEKGNQVATASPRKANNSKHRYFP